MPAAVYRRAMGAAEAVPVKRAATPFSPPPAAEKPPSPEVSKPDAAPTAAVEDGTVEDPLVPISEREISELKKELKRIANRRAIEIASKLSADSDRQDSELRASEKLVIKIDLELQRLSGGGGGGGGASSKQSGFANINNNNASSMLIDGGKMYTGDYIRGQLGRLREETKEQVRGWE